MTFLGKLRVFRGHRRDWEILAFMQERTTMRTDLSRVLLILTVFSIGCGQKNSRF